MKLNVGVVIIGSLYWDDQPHRRKWRNDRLQMANAIGVKVPIRYGRKSRSRGNTYTMVFSRGCQLGEGKAVPCSHSVSCVEELIEEAECLWAAEQPSEQSQRQNALSANWGCVALLANPRVQKDLVGVLNGWGKRVALEKNYNRKQYDEPDGRSLMDEQAILQIPWPNQTDTSIGLALDLVLATATKPEKDYPSARLIAQAWKDDRKGHVDYFWCNRKNGIRTFQDDEIEKYLRA